MADEPVAEAIRESTAVEVEASVTGDAVIAAEVAAVGDELADHAEVSEERHEEILEGEGWLRSEVDRLNTSMGTLQASITSSQQAILTTLQSLQTVLMQGTLNNLKPSEATTPSPPETLNPEEVVEEKVENAEGPRESKTEPPRRRQRRLI